jgi:hypothetical protein
VKVLKTLVVALGVTLWLPIIAQSAENSAQSEETPATSAKCLVAEVNPVTGHPVCINPRGAPVEAVQPSSLHPCKPRVHDKEDLTVYEHWSGC